MEPKTPAQIESDCLTEITEVLKKHKCSIEVVFERDMALGTPVLKYRPIIVFKEGGNNQ